MNALLMQSVRTLASRTPVIHSRNVRCGAYAPARFSSASYCSFGPSPFAAFTTDAITSTSLIIGARA
jgi:hypothetical protein